VAYTIQKIGKSLVKFFKPVRVIPPHVPGDPKSITGPESVSGNLDEDGKKAYRLLRFKKPEQDHLAEHKAALRSGVEEQEAEAKDLPQIPTQVPGQWIELVVMLLGACKKASHKIRKKIALDSYRVALSSRNKTKIRTVGSIVNTTGATIADPDDEQSAA